MKKELCILFFSALNFIHCNLYSQTPELDSLKTEYKNCSNDSVKCFILYFIVETEYNQDIWPKYNEILGEVALKNYKTGPPHTRKYYLAYFAMHLSNRGYLLMKNNNYVKAIEFYNRALIIQKTIGDTMGIATAYTNIGYSLRQQGDIVRAIENYHRALKMQLKMGDKRSASVSYNNIGFVHSMQGEYEKALNCYRNAEKINVEIGEKQGLATCYGNMAEIFYSYGDIENSTRSDYKQEGLKKGIEYLNKSMELLREVKDYSTLAGSLNALGGVLEHFGDPFCISTTKNCKELASKKSHDLIIEALKMREEIRDTFGLAQSYHSLAESLLHQGLVNEAFVYANKSFIIGKKFGIPDRIKDASGLLALILEKQGKYKEAVEMNELEIKMRDSIDSENIRKSTIKKQFQMEYERESINDSISNVAKMNEAKLKHEHAITEQRTYTYGGFAGLALMLIVAGVSFGAYRNKQKSNIIITKQKMFVETQKHIIEEKQKEIIDSINYARRIQRSQMPTEKYIQRTLNDLKGMQKK